MTQAPPTRQGHVPETADVPYEVTAVASIACSLVGLLLPLVNLAAVVLGVVAIRRVRGAEGRRQGQGLAIVGICIGVAGIGANVAAAFLVWTVVASVSSAQALSTPSPLFIHNQARAWANRADDGAYPNHVAEIIVSDRPSPVHHWALQSPVTQAGVQRVGDFDFINYDGTADADKKLRMALRNLDTSAASYQFGDCWFVRLGKPRASSRLVAGWAVHDGDGVRIVLDDGTNLRITRAAQWAAIWTTDAAERTLLDLPPLAAPPFPLTATRTPE